MVLRVLVFIILASSLSHQLMAQSPKEQAAEAYRLYTDSALESSAELYEKSLSQSPNSEYLFNLGNSYQKLGDTEKARKAYEGALNSSASSDELKSKAAYNLGNMEYSENEYAKAMEYYKKALLNNPEDVQASENFQIAQAQLQMQQQQQQQQQNQKQQEQQEQQESDSNQEQQQQPQQGEEDNENDSEDSENDQGQSGEDQEQPDEQPSQSTKLSKEQAEDFFKQLDELEKQTKSRLNEDMLKEKGKAKDKKITKDW